MEEGSEGGLLSGFRDLLHYTGCSDPELATADLMEKGLLLEISISYLRQLAHYQDIQSWLQSYLDWLDRYPIYRRVYFHVKTLTEDLPYLRLATKVRTRLTQVLAMLSPSFIEGSLYKGEALLRAPDTIELYDIMYGLHVISGPSSYMEDWGLVQTTLLLWSETFPN